MLSGATYVVRSAMLQGADLRRVAKCGQLRAALGTSPRTHLFTIFLIHESPSDSLGLHFQSLASSADQLLPAGSQHGCRVLSGLFVSGQCSHDHGLLFSITALRRHLYLIPGDPGQWCGTSSSDGVGGIGGLTTRTSDKGCSSSLCLVPSEYHMWLWHAD